MNSWTDEQIRQLRLRLGWSVADFARHFSCSFEQVQKWERGESFPSPQEMLVLEDLSQCVESLSRRVRSWAVADMTMGDSVLDQVRLDPLDRSEIEN